MKNIKGNYSGEGKKIAIIISQFNEFVSQELLSGCLDTLEKQKVNSEDIEIIWTPGAFEIPQVLAKLTEKNKFDAIICLGAIIRGDTPHFEYISSETAKGIAAISLAKKVPVIYGVITADTIEQAIERAGTKQGNRGREAALTAIEMANIFSSL